MSKSGEQICRLCGVKITPDNFGEFSVIGEGEMITCCKECYDKAAPFYTEKFFRKKGEHHAKFGRSNEEC